MIPRRSFFGKIALGPIYSQYNEITLYFEDSRSEFFYMQVVKKIFPGRVKRVVCLSGKTSVLKAAKLSADKKSVFIVDRDLSDFIPEEPSTKNVIYLKRYCIEWYLIEKDAWREIFREELPKITDEEFRDMFKFDDITANITSYSIDLAKAKIVAAKNGLENYSISALTYVKNGVINIDAVQNYIRTIKSKTSNESWDVIISDIEQITMASKDHEIYIIFSGKYFFNMLSRNLHHALGINRGVRTDSLMCRLAKVSNFNDLNYLAIELRRRAG